MLRMLHPDGLGGASPRPERVRADGTSKHPPKAITVDASEAPRTKPPTKRPPALSAKQDRGQAPSTSRRPKARPKT